MRLLSIALFDIDEARTPQFLRVVGCNRDGALAVCQRLIEAVFAGEQVGEVEQRSDVARVGIENPPIFGFCRLSLSRLMKREGGGKTAL